ncbi:hypothetical protein AAH476_35190, partial [Enterobacter cloacae subsp. cloacae]
FLVSIVRPGFLCKEKRVRVRCEEVLSNAGAIVPEACARKGEKMGEWLKVPGERSKGAASGSGSPPAGEIM